MKKTTFLLIAVLFILPSAHLLADDSSGSSDTATNSQIPLPPTPTPPSMPSPPQIPSSQSNGVSPSMPFMPGMSSRTVIATSDGGIVIVEGDKITKLDKDLNVTKSVDLSDSLGK